MKKTTWRCMLHAELGVICDLSQDAMTYCGVLNLWW